MKITSDELYEKLTKLVERKQAEHNMYQALAIRNDSVPNKKRTKLRGPITRHGRATFGSFKATTSYTVTTEEGEQTQVTRTGYTQSCRWSLPSMINMIASENGCTRVATNAEEHRLRFSARNANTTSR